MCVCKLYIYIYIYIYTHAVCVCVCFMWPMCSAGVGLLFGPCAAYAAGSGWQTPWSADGMWR